MDGASIVLGLVFFATVVALIVEYLLLRQSLNRNDAFENALRELNETNNAITESNERYESWFLEFKKRVTYSYDRIKAIDASGHFEADDEVGYFFKELKSLIERLNELGLLDEIEGEKKETNTEPLTDEKLKETLAKRAAIISAKNREKR